MAGEAIFIGYRRDDTADVAGRMHDAFAARFGKRRVFMDVDNLRPGADFGEYIKTVLPRCRVALILIGPNWLAARVERGARRLDDPNDWVRIEIETALATPGLDVVPVLVNGASMPRAEDLPESVRPLLRRHAAIIRRNPDFHDDVARLIAALRASVSSGILDLSKIGGKADDSAAARRAPLFIVGGVVATALAVFGLNAAGLLQLPAAQERAGQAPEAEADTPVLQLGQTFRDCSDCPEMVVIPAGSFTMGSPASEANRQTDEGPQRRITFARNFAVGRFEVTRGQYAAFTRSSGRADGGNCYTVNASGSSEQTASATWRSPGFTQGEDHPVVCVNWDDARAYVTWLNTQTRGGYRLLSEAEWEYVARAGTITPWVWGSEANSGCADANGADATARARYSSWTGASTCNDGALYTSAAGSYRANAFRVSDMIGNVWEWTQDCYATSLDSVPSNGSAYETSSCSNRVIRGGSRSNYPQDLRSAYRIRNPPSHRSYSLGFRVARTLN